MDTAAANLSRHSFVRLKRSHCSSLMRDENVVLAAAVLQVFNSFGKRPDEEQLFAFLTGIDGSTLVMFN